MDQMKKKVIEEYWLKKLSGDFKKISLPSVKDSISNDLIEGDIGVQDSIPFKSEIPGHLTDKLKKITKNSDIGLFILFLSGLNIALHKYTGIEDLIVGTLPPAGNSVNDEGNKNILFFRNYVSGKLTPKEIITKTKGVVVEAVDYSEYDFENLYETLRVKNNLDSLDIFNVAFIYEPFQRKNQSLDRFKLLFILSRSGDRLSLEVKFDATSASLQIIERFCRNMLTVFERLSENPGREISTMDILSPEEKKEIFYTFNDTGTTYPGHKTVHRLFEEQAAGTPDSIAVVGMGQRGKNLVHITYRRLNRESTQLSHLLRAKGVKSETIAGLMVERSIGMMIAMLGILKAGGAYLPIDPDFPEYRISYMLKDSGSRLLVSRKELAGELNGGCEVIDMNSAQTGNTHARSTGPEYAVSPDGLAYINYTSGSTGKPKGVMIEHRSLVNFIKGITDIIPFRKDDRILSLTTITFDIFGLETLLPLTAGSYVFIGNRTEQLDTTAASLVIQREDISIFQTTPSRLQLFLLDKGGSGGLASLNHLLVGGEAFPEPLLHKVRSLFHGGIYNLYGPTETTIWSAVKDVGGRKALNIGKPIANTGIYILEKTGSPRPVGVPGELCICGDGVARGYLNKPELTAERFDRGAASLPPLPFYPSTSLYRTGDLARWLPDGNIEFLGRLDRQVKIRGFRVELEEIENLLLKHEDIEEAVVLLRDTTEKNSEDSSKGNIHLTAYVVSGEKFDVSQLREYLLKELPGYMIPTFFMQVDRIPLTYSGKVDRKALASIGTLLRPRIEFVAPRNDIERKIAELWKTVLEQEQVGIDDNFFDLGGTSLDVIKLNNEFKDVFDEDELVLKMFRYPTISTFAQYLIRKKAGVNDSEKIIDRPVPGRNVKNIRINQKNKRRAGRNEHARIH